MVEASVQLASPNDADLRAAWAQLRAEQSGLRVREAATRLGVSEAALVASECGRNTLRLRPDWLKLLPKLATLGSVMCLTRNDAVVHERHGRFENVEVNGVHGLVTGPDIDLRIMLRHWQHAFATTQELPSGQRSSLQFFDAAGTAVHKIYLTENGDARAYERLVEGFRHTDQNQEFTAKPPLASRPKVDDDAVDRESFAEAWRGMQDTHEFVALLSRFKLDREQALRLIGTEFARPVPVKALRQVLEQAAETRLPIMVFVGNPGTIQIHTGTVENLRAVGDWYNVLDPAFNLHIREDLLARAWIVRKPTADGIVSSLEVYDQQGRIGLQFFGERKPGRPELVAWAELLATVDAEMSDV